MLGPQQATLTFAWAFDEPGFTFPVITAAVFAAQAAVPTVYYGVGASGNGSTVKVVAGGGRPVAVQARAVLAAMRIDMRPKRTEARRII